MLFSEAFAYRADYLQRIEEIEAPFIQRLNQLLALMKVEKIFERWQHFYGVKFHEGGIQFIGEDRGDYMEIYFPLPESVLDLDPSEYPAWIEQEYAERLKQQRTKAEAEAKAKAEKEAVAQLLQEQEEYEIYLRIKGQVEGEQREG